jgi:hypothetical protein
MIENLWALAHEGYGLQPVRRPDRIIGPLGPEGMLFSTFCPQGLKPIVVASFMYGLKPVPFEPTGVHSSKADFKNALGD